MYNIQDKKPEEQYAATTMPSQILVPTKFNGKSQIIPIHKISFLEHLYQRAN